MVDLEVVKARFLWNLVLSVFLWGLSGRIQISHHIKFMNKFRDYFNSFFDILYYKKYIYMNFLGCNNSYLEFTSLIYPSVKRNLGEMFFFCFLEDMVY